MNAPTDRWEPYRIITDLDGLREVFCDRADDLNISRVTIDVVGELTPGYSSKLLCDPPMRPLTNETIPKMLKATRLVLIAVVDDERFAAVKGELSKRKRKVRAVARIKRVKGYFTKENAGNCAKKRWAVVSEKERSRIASRMNKVRWRRWRQEQRAMASGLSAATASPELHCAPLQPGSPAPNTAPAAGTHLQAALPPPETPAHAPTA